MREVAKFDFGFGFKLNLDRESYNFDFDNRPQGLVFRNAKSGGRCGPLA